MECAGEIAEYKKECGLPIFDAARENSLVEKNLKRIDKDEFKPYYRDYIKSVMNISKNYQHFLIKGSKVAYSGIEGSFAAISAGKIFPGAKRVSYRNFEEAYKAVVDGECELAVLPIENSYAGEVGNVLDLMFKGELFINGVYELKVSQCLLGVKGATKDTIKTVVSHPQALEQCNEFIYDNGYTSITSLNTAVAAKEVAEGGDITIGAIASRETAELYGLNIIDHDINKSGSNTTRFAVFSKTRAEVKKDDEDIASILMFTVKNEAGSLAKAISIMGDLGLNMRGIKSRPLRDKNWEYYFYTEVEGYIDPDDKNIFLKALKKHCAKLKVIGTYKPNSVI
nr:chorismate mutase [Lachnospiraceae bacterium]